MKKRTTICLFLIFSFLLVACNKKSEPVERKKHGNYTLYYFYIETCHNCQEFEKNVTPLLEKEFGDELTIIKYDLDLLSTKEPYDQVISKLTTEVTDEDYGQAPTVAFDGYFFKVGISDGQEEELVNDMIRAINGEELGTELEASRYLYK